MIAVLSITVRMKTRNAVTRLTLAARSFLRFGVETMASFISGFEAAAASFSDFAVVPFASTSSWITSGSLMFSNSFSSGFEPPSSSG